MKQVDLFTQQMLPYIGVVIEEKPSGGRVLEIRLPEEMPR
jgi:hypothetical protein